MKYDIYNKYKTIKYVSPHVLCCKFLKNCCAGLPASWTIYGQRRGGKELPVVPFLISPKYEYNCRNDG